MVGVPDVQLGEIIVCVVSYRSPPEDVKKEMDEYLADKLAKYKIPKKYFVVASIPRNHLGKVSFGNGDIKFQWSDLRFSYFRSTKSHC